MTGGEPRALPVADHDPRPEEATAEDLALAYAQRWEIENTFDELKTHQRGPRKVLRSRSPPLVLQEIWGHLCCHYAIRTLMRDATMVGGRNPIGSRSLPHCGSPEDYCPTALFPPHDHRSIIRLWNLDVEKLLRRVNPPRRLRANARVVKREDIKWPAKRARHQHHPQPTQPPTFTMPDTN